MHISPMERKCSLSNILFMNFIRRRSTITLTSGKSHITLISLILSLSQNVKILATAWFTQESNVAYLIND